MLNTNPVLVAQHFQYRAETFFNEVLRSPHLHALIWTSNCPYLTDDNKQAYIDYIDQHVQAYMPSEEDDPELHNLVKTYQKHTIQDPAENIKTFSVDSILVSFSQIQQQQQKPLSDDPDEAIKSYLQDKHKETLSLVKQQINECCFKSQQA